MGGWVETEEAVNEGLRLRTGIAIPLQNAVKSEADMPEVVEFEDEDGWNIRRREFLTTVWKTKSKMDDLKQEIEPQLQHLLNLLQSVKAMAEGDIELIPLSEFRRQMGNKDKEFSRIETLFEEPRLVHKINELELLRKKTKAMALKALKLEECFARVGEGLSRNPELDQETVVEFIEFAGDVCMAASNLLIAHSDAKIEFFKSSTEFQNNWRRGYLLHTIRNKKIMDERRRVLRLSKRENLNIVDVEDEGPAEKRTRQE